MTIEEANIIIQDLNTALDQANEHINSLYRERLEGNMLYVKTLEQLAHDADIVMHENIRLRAKQE